MSEKRASDGFSRQNAAAGLEFHAGMSRAHKTAMDSYEDGSTERKFHEAAMQAHVAAGEHCSACLGTLKTVGTDPDLAKVLEPTEVSGVAPDAPLRAIPRAGQPPIGRDTKLAPEIQKIIGVNLLEEE